LGGKGYDILIVLNRLLNWFLKKIGKNKKSFSKAIKDSVKKAVSWVSNFELIAAQLAIEKKYDYVVCGHIHKQQIRTITTEKGSVIYLNSGDWVENLTALEYKNGSWSIYQYDENNFPIDSSEIEKIDVYNLINKIIAS
jgi:UDP-2,3-diacylglucosamine pyrophosphatase LpxH